MDPIQAVGIARSGRRIDDVLQCWEIYNSLGNFHDERTTFLANHVDIIAANTNFGGLSFQQYAIEAEARANPTAKPTARPTVKPATEPATGTPATGEAK